MSRLDVLDLCPREELPDRGHRLVGDVAAPRTADEERRAVVLHVVRLRAVREVGHGVERVGQRRERDAEDEPRLVVPVAHQVGEEELADGEGLGCFFC